MEVKRKGGVNLTYIKYSGLLKRRKLKPLAWEAGVMHHGRGLWTVMIKLAGKSVEHKRTLDKDEPPGHQVVFDAVEQTYRTLIDNGSLVRVPVCPSCW